MEQTPNEPAAQDVTPAANENHEQVKDAQAVLDKNRQLLEEMRTLKSELKEHKQFKADLELKEKEQQGQYQEVIAALRDENKTLKEKHEADKKAAAFNKFKTEISSLASAEGCADIDLMFAAMTKEEMASVEVDDHFNVNQDDAKRLVTQIKERKPILFGNKSVNVNNVNGGFKIEKPSVDSMSKEELLNKIYNS